MNDSNISGPARKNNFAEIVQRDPALRVMIQKDPESLLIFVRAMVTASRISNARAELLEAVTRALDTSDQVLEAIDGGFELSFRLERAAVAIAHLGTIFADVVPESAMSGSRASN
jgi:hypothetical protein